MVLVVIAEVEARQQRQPLRIRIRPRVVAVMKRLLVRAVWQIRPNREELKRRQQARDGPEYDYVQR